MNLPAIFDGLRDRSVNHPTSGRINNHPLRPTETRRFPVWDIRYLRDLVYIWGDVALLLFIPALILGAAIGRFVGRWYLCVLLSYAVAIALFVLTRVQQRLNHPLSLIELLAYSAVFALPSILAMASVGYFAGRMLKERRDLKSR
jgi:hypothetical protein